MARVSRGDRSRDDDSLVFAMTKRELSAAAAIGILAGAAAFVSGYVTAASVYRYHCERTTLRSDWSPAKDFCAAEARAIFHTP